jgi:hypothetical protein
VAWARIGAVTWLVDADGAAFVAGAAPGLPELVGAGAPDDPRLAEGAAWLAALAAQGLAPPEALWLGDADPARAPVLALAPAAGAPGARVLLGAGEREAKLARLARLLASGLPELATTGEIDLRFGTAVVLRPRPEPELATDSRNSNGG